MPKVSGLHYCLREGRHKPVVLKSIALKTYMKRDGMTRDEAEGFWDYNMAGSDSTLIAVDDTLTQARMGEILQEEADDVKSR